MTSFHVEKFCRNTTLTLIVHNRAFNIFIDYESILHQKFPDLRYSIQLASCYILILLQQEHAQRMTSMLGKF